MPLKDSQKSFVWVSALTNWVFIVGQSPGVRRDLNTRFLSRCVGFFSEQDAPAIRNVPKVRHLISRSDEFRIVVDVADFVVRRRDTTKRDENETRRSINNGRMFQVPYPRLFSSRLRRRCERDRPVMSSFLRQTVF